MVNPSDGIHDPDARVLAERIDGLREAVRSGLTALDDRLDEFKRDHRDLYTEMERHDREQDLETDALATDLAATKAKVETFITGHDKVHSEDAASMRSTVTLIVLSLATLGAGVIGAYLVR